MTRVQMHNWYTFNWTVLVYHAAWPDVRVIRSENNHYDILNAAGVRSVKHTGQNLSGQSAATPETGRITGFTVDDGYYNIATISSAAIPAARWREVADTPTKADDRAFALSLLSGNDELIGADGNDRIYGLTGNDTISGGRGRDRLRGDEGHDRIHGGDDSDVLIGGVGNDRLFGDERADVLKGQDGNDRLDGGSGNDLLVGGNGDDRLFGGLGNDRLYGNGGDDVLIGGTTDQLYGGSGNDIIRGGDYASGGAGDDIIRSVVDADGGKGNDRLIGGQKTERLFGGMGDDHLQAVAGQPNLGNWLVGGQGNDVLVGGDGSLNALDGGAGADRIFASAGADLMNGGPGRDLFIYRTNADLLGVESAFYIDDSISDFQTSVDVINLSGVDADITTPFDDSFRFVSSVFTGAAGELLFSQTRGRLEGDTDGDGNADFVILFHGQNLNLTEDDIIL